jgi:hypothetical protein
MCGFNNDISTGSTSSNNQSMQTTGMALTGLGTLYGMNSIGNSYDSQIATAKANAQIAAQQVYQTGVAGAATANQQRERGAQIIGTQRAGYGASGIDTNSGTALNVQASTAGTAEQNAQTVLYNTMINQWSSRQSQLQYEQQASNLESAKQDAQSSALITGLTKLASQYYSFGATM